MLMICNSIRPFHLSISLYKMVHYDVSCVTLMSDLVFQSDGIHYFKMVLLWLLILQVGLDEFLSCISEYEICVGYEGSALQI